MNDPIQLVYVTTPDRETATSLATLAVEEGLAACGNVGGPITSVFRWEGAVQTGEEWTLLLKTSAAQLGMRSRGSSPKRTPMRCRASWPSPRAEGSLRSTTGFGARARLAVRRRLGVDCQRNAPHAPLA